MALGDNKYRAQSSESTTETQVNQSGFPQEGPPSHSIFLSSVRNESSCCCSSRSGEAPAAPGAGLAMQQQDRGEEPDLRALAACMEPPEGGAELRLSFLVTLRPHLLPY